MTLKDLILDEEGHPHVHFATNTKLDNKLSKRGREDNKAMGIGVVYFLRNYYFCSLKHFLL